MARDFNTVLKALAAARRDPLQDVDETVPGFIPDPSTYQCGKPGKRRARTFSQAIAEATRCVDAGMNCFTPQKPDLSSASYKPDWRGHFVAAQSAPASRAEQLRRKFEPNAFKKRG